MYHNKSRQKSKDRLGGTTIILGDRNFVQFIEKEELHWLKDPILKRVRRLKTLAEADYDTDEEETAKEQKKCLFDLKIAINNFVR